MERRYRPQLAMAILIPTLQQLTGINVVMFYAPVLFKTIGFGGTASLMSSVTLRLVSNSLPRLGCTIVVNNKLQPLPRQEELPLPLLHLHRNGTI